MAWLAPQVSLPVPVPELFSADPLRFRHRPIMGEPWTPGADDEAEGQAFGTFLKELHALPLDEAVAAGAREADDLIAEQQRLRERCSTEVVPRLPRSAQAPALAVLMRQIGVDEVDVALVHADVRAEHLLRGERGLAGVIDWLDAGIGDPTMDLAWPLHGATPRFADGFRAAYGVSPNLEARAGDHHLWCGMLDALRALDRADDAMAEGALVTLERRLSDVESMNGGRRR